MKHRFLLDENILHHGIKGVDRHNNRDLAATTFLRLIGANCHSIVLNPELLRRYNTQLRRLSRERTPILQPEWFIRELLHNSAKRSLEYDDPPELPADVAIPEEDKSIVRAALISHPIVVANDENLVEAINGHPSLELRALYAVEAIVPASES